MGRRRKEEQHELDDAIDQLIVGVRTQDDFLGLMQQLKERMVNRILEAEMRDHQESQEEDEGGRVVRNGHTRKTVQTEGGSIQVKTPRDREGSFEPQLIQKRQVKLMGLEPKILALYARGLEVREVATAVKDLYQVEISPTLVAEITNEVMSEVKEWRSRPLESTYVVLWIDAIQVKVREDGRVVPKSLFVVMGLNMAGEKDLLGFWIAETEGARFWATVLNELRTRGVQDVFFICMDGLKGLPEAVESIFPRTVAQLCIVHILRAACRYVNWKDRKPLCAAMAEIYRAPTLEAAEEALERFADVFGKTLPHAVAVWRRNWDRIIPFLQLPEPIRKIVYTTNAIESANSVFRKYTRSRKVFGSDDGAIRDFFLAYKLMKVKWSRPRDWTSSLAALMAMLGEERVAI